MVQMHEIVVGSIQVFMIPQWKASGHVDVLVIH